MKKRWGWTFFHRSFSSESLYLAAECQKLTNFLTSWFVLSGQAEPVYVLLYGRSLLAEAQTKQPLSYSWIYWQHTAASLPEYNLQPCILGKTLWQHLMLHDPALSHLAHCSFIKRGRFHLLLHLPSFPHPHLPGIQQSHSPGRSSAWELQLRTVSGHT